MSDRFGNDKWRRMLEYSGIVDQQTADRLRQGAELSEKEHMVLMKKWMDPSSFSVGGAKFTVFPIHSNNPGMAPSGSPCGDGKMCHNGRCLSRDKFRKTTDHSRNGGRRRKNGGRG